MVQPQDKVYISAHGAGVADGRYIGDDRGDGTEKKYTPDEMAHTLEKEGLTKFIGVVKMYACGSGLSRRIPSYAQRLKIAMVKRGYNRVMVTGYESDLSPDYIHCLTGDGINQFTPQRHKNMYWNDESVSGLVRTSLHRIVD